MPETMVRVSMPVSMVSFRSLSVLGTRSAARTVAVRMSIAPNWSKVTSGFCGSTFFAASSAALAASAASRSALMAARRAICASTTLSSIFWNSRTLSPRACPAGISSGVPSIGQERTMPSVGTAPVCRAFPSPGL